MNGQYSTSEWTVDEWRNAWHIGVGKVYQCRECANLIMVVKGGTGALEPKCHGQPMAPLEVRR